MTAMVLARKLVTLALLAFVAASVGWALMRAFTASDAGEEPVGGLPDRTDVLFFHPTARCAACNRMEATAEQLFRENFAEELASGRLTWREVNFEHHDALAGRYRVVSSTIVIVTVRDGEEATFTRLDDALQRAGDGDAFRTYVRAAVEASLAAPNPKSENQNSKQISSDKSQNPNGNATRLDIPGALPFGICCLGFWNLFRISCFEFRFFVWGPP